jgi:hypothetical protein
MITACKGERCSLDAKRFNMLLCLRFMLFLELAGGPRAGRIQRMIDVRSF